MENTISFQFGTYDLANYKQETEDRGFFANHINPQYSKTGLVLADAVRTFAKEVSMGDGVQTSFAFTNEPVAGAARRFEAYGLSFGGKPVASVVLSSQGADETVLNTATDNVDEAIERFETLSKGYKASYWPAAADGHGLQFVSIGHKLQRLMLSMRDKCIYSVFNEDGRLVVYMGLKDSADTGAYIRLVTEEDRLFGQQIETDNHVLAQAPAEAHV